MKVTVVFFARSRELAGKGSAIIELSSGDTTREFKDALMRQVRLSTFEIQTLNTDYAMRSII